METQYFTLNPDPDSDAEATSLAIAAAARAIQMGGLVAFPTETVYGLGANATDAEAVAKIYVAKQRALNDPLIVHCALDAAALRAPADALARQEIAGVLSAQQRERVVALVQRFWPGPLTLVLPRGARIPPNVTAGLDSVAVRMPDHAVALALIRASDVPIAAPSANRFGHVSPTTAQHVRDDLDGRIDMVLDGGATAIGVESTVLDLTQDPPAILRPGGLARAEIERVIGSVGAGEQGSRGEGEKGREGEEAAQVSPGLLSKHYAPRARLRVVRDTAELLRQRSHAAAQGLRVGLLVMASQREACAGLMPQYVLGQDLASVARNLYAGLRALDSAGVDVILVSEVERAGIGEAIADRLRRGAA
ncbi:MAG: L-threonylcarbamoyladenylate synthase [Chloroflexi bacterium]|nr:L-threonylcarbamoyladenylate synthase [Chloroflexota bacterium]